MSIHNNENPATGHGGRAGVLRGALDGDQTIDIGDRQCADGVGGGVARQTQIERVGRDAARRGARVTRLGVAESEAAITGGLDRFDDRGGGAGQHQVAALRHALNREDGGAVGGATV